MRKRKYTPIYHQPCPDMAGCTDFDPAKTERSMQWVQELKARLSAKIAEDAAKAQEAARARRFARMRGAA
ncbi:hypothetical protein [Grimontia hollisae]|uniref:Uncharacterized protein n=1 Tax=Grimontia hollisae TaxID=673 RepID=A0A377HP04_GRIHO|nr:hypothetical protein [Grimontia hollisae]STO57445.1 Uncharacterised protein [Grimontia hollisae]